MIGSFVIRILTDDLNKRIWIICVICIKIIDTGLPISQASENVWKVL